MLAWVEDNRMLSGKASFLIVFHYVRWKITGRIEATVTDGVSLRQVDNNMTYGIVLFWEKKVFQ